MTLPRWSPETQARLIRIAAVVVFVLIAIVSVLAMQRMQSVMRPPPVDRHHMFTPVVWGPFTLPSRTVLTAWSFCLVGLFTPACYCMALWSSASLFAHAGTKEAFPPALAAGLKRIGIWLIVGAVPSFITVLFGTYLIFMANGKKLHMWGAIKGALEASLSGYAVGLVLGLTGIVLLMAALTGQKLRGHLDEFV
jgi:hypothetical protein